MDAGYKNTLGSRKDVLITGMFYIGNARTVFQEMVLDGSYNRHVLITGVLISGIHCTTFLNSKQTDRQAHKIYRLLEHNTLPDHTIEKL